MYLYLVLILHIPYKHHLIWIHCYQLLSVQIHGQWGCITITHAFVLGHLDHLFTYIPIGFTKWWWFGQSQDVLQSQAVEDSDDAVWAGTKYHPTSDLHPISPGHLDVHPLLSLPLLIDHIQQPINWQRIDQLLMLAHTCKVLVFDLGQVSGFRLHHVDVWLGWFCVLTGLRLRKNRIPRVIKVPEFQVLGTSRQKVAPVLTERNMSGHLWQFVTRDSQFSLDVPHEQPLVEFVTQGDQVFAVWRKTQRFHTQLMPLQHSIHSHLSLLLIMSPHSDLRLLGGRLPCCYELAIRRIRNTSKCAMVVVEQESALLVEFCVVNTDDWSDRVSNLAGFGVDRQLVVASNLPSNHTL